MTETYLVAGPERPEHLRLARLNERVSAARTLAHNAPLNPLRTDANGHRWIQQNSTAWADRATEYGEVLVERRRLLRTINSTWVAQERAKPPVPVVEVGAPSKPEPDWLNRPMSNLQKAILVVGFAALLFSSLALGSWAGKQAAEFVAAKREQLIFPASK